MADINIVKQQIDKNREIYENYSELIDREIQKRKLKWHLTAVNYIDFDDISQVLRTHIAKKLQLYNPEKSAFVNWLNTVISNQIRNLLRNHYGSFAKVCNKCAAAEGEEGCRIYGTQCIGCPAYYNWTLSKKNAYDVRLPLPTENHFNEVNSLPDAGVDVEKSVPSFHEKIAQFLKAEELKVYTMVYVEHKSDTQVAANLYKKSVGLVTKKEIKAVENLKTRIMGKARELVYSGDVDVLGSYEK